MTTFKHTAEAAAFIATAASRETSPEIMKAIVAFAADADAADYIWETGLGDFDSESAQAFVNTATRDGTIDPADLLWGASGADWLPA